MKQSLWSVEAVYFSIEDTLTVQSSVNTLTLKCLHALGRFEHSAIKLQTIFDIINKKLHANKKA